jgi:hypothetical protein
MVNLKPEKTTKTVLSLPKPIKNSQFHPTFSPRRRGTVRPVVGGMTPMAVLTGKGDQVFW